MEKDYIHISVVIKPFIVQQGKWKASNFAAASKNLILNASNQEYYRAYLSFLTTLIKCISKVWTINPILWLY